MIVREEFYEACLLACCLLAVVLFLFDRFLDWILS